MICPSRIGFSRPLAKRIVVVLTICLASSMVVRSGLSVASPTTAPKLAKAPGVQPALTPASEYAPVNLLLSQLDEYVEDLVNDLEEEANYNEDIQSRVELNASTVAVICLILGNHDEAPPIAAKAPALIAAAGELANQSGDYSAASAALEQLQDVIAADAPAESEPIGWNTTVADIGCLMRQVPIVNNSMRRGLSSRRFERERERTLGHAVVMAAIAQASAHDTNYTWDDSSAELWGTMCYQVRDACTTTMTAVADGNLELAQEGMQTIAHSCDACHAIFR